MDLSNFFNSRFKPDRHIAGNRFCAAGTTFIVTVTTLVCVLIAVVVSTIVLVSMKESGGETVANVTSNEQRSQMSE
ncbi:nitrogen assimilation transcription factor nirA [Physcia stellaris]|nr:nitrogen assimilation transcription factor nirA [Physcia stellaris]